MAASVLSLTKVIHVLADSFFAPTIYVWIICHRRRVCMMRFLVCVFKKIFFERGKKKLCAFHCWLQISFRLRSLVCVYTIWRMIWSNCAVFMFIHSLWLNKKENQNAPLYYSFLIFILAVNLSFGLLVFRFLIFASVWPLSVWSLLTRLPLTRCRHPTPCEPDASAFPHSQESPRHFPGPRLWGRSARSRWLTAAGRGSFGELD